MKQAFLTILLLSLLVISTSNAYIQSQVTALSPPIVEEINILPENPDTTQDLVCEAQVVEIFGEETSYSWLVTGMVSSLSIITLKMASWFLHQR